MCGLAPIIQEVDEDPFQQIDFYEYPELYHFFYSRVQSDEQRENLLKQHQPEETNAVLELACGTGLLLTQIEDNYENVMGVDVDEGMLGFARAHTDTATLRQADITSWSAAEEGLSFDAAVMVGALFHLTEDSDVRALADNIYRSLRDGGTFVSSFIPYSNIGMNSFAMTKTVQSERFQVKQNKYSVFTSSDGHYVGTYLYEIMDMQEDLGVTIGCVENERKHGPSIVEDSFIDAGFNEVKLLNTEGPKIIIRARR